MGHIKEPIGIDLIVAPMQLSEEDREALSAVIAEYKKTGKVPKLTSKVKKVHTRKKTATPAKQRKKVISEKI